MSTKLGTTGLKWLPATILISGMMLISNCASKAPSPTTTIPMAATATHVFLTDTPEDTSTSEIEILTLEESTSPNGEWTATVTVTTQGTSSILQFAATNNLDHTSKVITTEEYQEPVDPHVGYVHPYVLQWAKTGHHLYYSLTSTGGDGCYAPYKPAGSDLYRYDLNAGEMDFALLIEYSSWMAFSPDENKLAYFDNWRESVVIFDMRTRQEFVHTLPNIENESGMETATRYIHWSPDGHSLVYAHLLGVCDYKIWYSNIIKIDAETHEQTVLVSHDEHGYIPLEWSAPEQILMKDNDDGRWVLNPHTKEITPVQP